MSLLSGFETFCHILTLSGNGVCLATHLNHVILIWPRGIVFERTAGGCLCLIVNEYLFNCLSVCVLMFLAAWNKAMAQRISMH